MRRQGLVLLAMATAACAPDASTVTAPPAHPASVVVPSNAIIVNTAAELIAALTPANAGSHIHVRAGTYNMSQLLVVPDSAVLSGDGEMVLDESGRPEGFAAGSRTLIKMTSNTTGDFLTLGNGSSIRGLAIEDLPGRPGNGVGLRSRGDNDDISASIADVEILNPTAHSIIQSGPSGCAVAVLSQNPNLGAAPAAHSGSQVAVAITRVLIRAPSSGTGCGLFAFNFAPLSSVSVDVSESIVGGGLIANGGVSRPDAVHDSRTVIQSRRNVYRDDSADPCTSRHLGWNVNGGSGVPVGLQIGETSRNTLEIHSLSDRLEGFTSGILAAGGRRFFGSPTAGQVTGNTFQLALIGTTFATSSCGGATFPYDFRLAGAAVSGSTLIPGDGNTMRVVMRGVTGSGARANVYADVLGSSGPVAAEFAGTGNTLEFAGNTRSFAQTNTGITPSPGAQFFTSGK